MTLSHPQWNGNSWLRTMDLSLYPDKNYQQRKRPYTGISDVGLAAVVVVMVSHLVEQTRD